MCSYVTVWYWLGLSLINSLVIWEAENQGPIEQMSYLRTSPAHQRSHSRGPDRPPLTCLSGKWDFELPSSLPLTPLTVSEETGEVGNKRMTLRSHLRGWERGECFGKSPRWTRRKMNGRGWPLSRQVRPPLSRPPASPNRVSLLILPSYGHWCGCLKLWENDSLTGYSSE